MISPLPGEQELLDRCAEGDTAAFEPLVTHYEHAICNLAFRMVGNREDARDVAQETFIRAFRKMADFEGRASFATWLFAIAVNQSRSHLRRRAAGMRKSEVQMSALDNTDEDRGYDPPGDDPAPDDRLRSEETRRQIEQAIAELDDDARAIVVLRDIEDLDYDGIADVLGCSRGTVKSRLHRARCELRQKLTRLASR